VAGEKNGLTASKGVEAFGKREKEEGRPEKNILQERSKWEAWVSKGAQLFKE